MGRAWLLVLVSGASTVVGCEDEAKPPKVPERDEIYQTQPTARTDPPAAVVADDDEDDPPPRRHKPKKPDCAIGKEDCALTDPSGNVVMTIPRAPTVEEKREEVQRALEPLVRNAVADYEKAAAKRALDVALAAVEKRPAKAAIQSAFAMYQADVDRAVRLKTGGQ